MLDWKKTNVKKMLELLKIPRAFQESEIQLR